MYAYLFKGDVVGHPFRGNQFTNGLAGPLFLDANDLPTTRDKAVSINQYHRTEGTEVDHRLASQLRRHADEVEPIITAAMAKLLPPTATLARLEFRKKEEKSLARKIRTDALGENIPPEKAAAKIGDSVRYTMVSPKEDYASHVTQMMQHMTDAGFTLMEAEGKFKNRWGSKDRHGLGTYQGINTNWRHQDGTVFEMQFHTVESNAAVDANHKDYELARDLNTTLADIRAANIRMDRVQRGVPVPPGLNNIRMPRKK